MDSTRPVIVVTGKRRPHEIMLLVFSATAGAVLLTGLVPWPTSMREELGVWLMWWATGMLLSGMLGLIGCYWRRNLWVALSLERAGMLFNAACNFVYAVMVVAHNGKPALFTAWFFMSWVVADVARSLQIGNDLRSLGRGIRDARHDA